MLLRTIIDHYDYLFGTRLMFVIKSTIIRDTFFNATPKRYNHDHQNLKFKKINIVNSHRFLLHQTTTSMLGENKKAYL